MERLTNSIADKIAGKLKLDKDNKEVIAYGLFAIMDIALSIFLVGIFGLIFHAAAEALIISFAGSILRKYSGGAHAGSPGRCIAIGTIICVGGALLFLHLIGPVITPGLLVLLGIIVFAWSYYLIFKLAPVDSPAKPIRTREKKIRMKKGSVFVLSTYLIIVGITAAIYIYYGNKVFLIYSLCIYGGTAWQIFTLTKLGHSAINKMDSFINQIYTIKKGGE
jgi:accessory gene regulator B